MSPVTGTKTPMKAGAATKSVPVGKKAAAQQQNQGKSGLRKLKPGEVLFHQNELADSLFIIQKGQLRLFLPKGRGYVELAVLRAGEVLGEMAYFDEKARRRSASAAAIISTEVIEVSFNAFEKTMAGLNPWFKTIINTLANRLRKTNDKVKELESNSIGFGKGGKVADYKFFSNVDIVKLLSLLYTTLKAHGEIKNNRTYLHMNKFSFYARDIFTINEAKFEEFIHLLKEQGMLDITNDEENLPKMMVFQGVEVFRNLLLFFNTQRITADDKKLKVSHKCERFLKRILDQVATARAQAGKDADTGDHDIARLNPILQEFKESKLLIFEDDLVDAIEAGLVDDIIVDEQGNLTSKVHFTKLSKVYPAIKMMNAVERHNESKVAPKKKEQG